MACANVTKKIEKENVLQVYPKNNKMWRQSLKINNKAGCIPSMFSGVSNLHFNIEDLSSQTPLGASPALHYS